MPGTLVANGDFLRPSLMAPTTVSWAWVNGVLVVDAAARCIAFDDLDTHGCKADNVDVDEAILFRSNGGVLTC